MNAKRRTVLMMGPLPKAQMAQLEESYALHCLWKSEDPEALLNGVRQEVQAVVSSNDAPGVSAKLIAALPNLEIIAHWGTGYDIIDVKTAKDRGIAVTHTPDVLQDTADMGMGLVLAVLRRMVEGDIYVRSGQWAKKAPFPLGRSLNGKTLGIIGMGRIGQAVAKRAGAFGMKVVWHGPRKKKGVGYPHYSDLLNMAEISDILMVTCLYSPETHHMIDAKVLKALGKDGVLVNIARGRIVNEKDLVDALEGGVIAGAGLDVFENEPDVPAALCRLDNVVLQPHRGSATRETRSAQAQLVVDNLGAYFEKAETLTPV